MLNTPSRHLRGLIACLLAATWATAILPTVTVTAQERDSDRERDDAEERRERWRSYQRDRSSDRDDDREDRDRDERSAEREPSPRGSSDQGMAMTDYAKGLVKQYDKNSNMMLDGEEIKNLRGRAATADANGDKVITVDELVAGLSGGSSRTTAASSPATNAPSESTSRDDDDRSDRRERDRGFLGYSRRDRDRDSDRSEPSASTSTSKRVLLGTATGSAKQGEPEKNARRTYRFTPAADRLPEGLPSWFKAQDKNGDGQVAMSEYSRSWSTSTVAKFRGYDLNDDGIVTAKEAAKSR